MDADLVALLPQDARTLCVARNQVQNEAARLYLLHLRAREPFLCLVSSGSRQLQSCKRVLRVLEVDVKSSWVFFGGT